MTYKILDRNEIITISTTVEFTFDDNTTEVIDIQHFEPESEDIIIKNIENRYESECLKRQFK